MINNTSSASADCHLLVNQWLSESVSGKIRVGHAFSGTSERALETDEHLYLEGTNQSQVHIVLSGVIGTYKMLPDGRRQIVGFFYPGDTLGLDHPGVYATSATALNECTVRCVPLTAVDKLFETEPAFGQSILRLTSRELAEVREQLVSLGRKSAMEKIATFLLHIVRRNEQFGLGGETILLPMKRADIGDYLGLTVETVSRNITKLKVAQVIRLKTSSQVQILDRDSLEFMANGNAHM